MHWGGPELLFLSAIGNKGVGFQDIISLTKLNLSQIDSSGILNAVPGILTYCSFFTIRPNTENDGKLKHSRSHWNGFGILSSEYFSPPDTPLSGAPGHDVT